MDIAPDFIEAFHKIAHRKEIPSFLKKWNLDTNLCEIGVRMGGNFTCLLQADPKNVYGIDFWQEDGFFSQEQQDKYYNNMKQMEASDKRIKIIKDFSLNAVNLFEDNFFDYVYIDANHLYEAISQDIKEWYKKVKIGGVLGGHDYVRKPRRQKELILAGVKRAIDEFLKENNIKYFHLTSEKCASWMIIREF